MEKFIYNLVLEAGVSEAEFLATDAAGMQVKSNLDMFDGLLCMLLTQDEATTLENSPKVKSIQIDVQPEPTFYPTETFTRNKTLVTRDLPPGSGTNTIPGSGYGNQYSGTHFYHSSEQGGENATGPIGFFTNQGEDASIPGATIKQKFTGQFVDVVCYEAGASTITSALDNTHEDPDFTTTDIESHNFTLINDGSSAWLATGTDRITTRTNASNQTLVIYPGDTITIVNNASSSHPLELVEGTFNTQVADVTNQGAYGGQALVWTAPERGGAYTVKYRCSVHTSTMVASIIVNQRPSRFVPMDWSDYDIGASDPANNQVTNNLTSWCAPHARGVMSAAAGSSCGWASASSIRLIYTQDGMTTGFNAILAWHQSKPVNPITGVRNATVVTGSFGYPSYSYDGAVPVDSVTRINAYDELGNLTQINRPVGGWGNDLTPFTDNYLIPRAIQDPADSVVKWCIPFGVNFRFDIFETAVNSFESAGGIYFFKSCGNYSQIGAPWGDPRYNNNIEVSGNYIDITASSIISLSAGGNSTTTRYPLRVIDNGGPNMISVAACQNSTTNPLLDDYSSRGLFADVSASGSYTWTSYYTEISFGSGSYVTYADGFWSYFGGTSCAAPIAAGAAAIFLDNYFTKTGTFPSTAKLKELLQKYAKPLDEDIPVDFSSVSAAALNFTSNRLYSSSDLYAVKSAEVVNGGIELSGIHGTPGRVFIPWGVAMGTGQYIADPRGPSYGSRPQSGQAYPRRKIKVEA